jgi:hypothetical protein
MSHIEREVRQGYFGFYFQNDTVLDTDIAI